MRIVVDERETELYANLTTTTMEYDKTIIQIEKSMLPLGDVIFKTGDETADTIHFFERKTIRDLLASITDGRYREQSFRLKNATNVPPHRVVYIVEGTFQGCTNQEKQRVYSSMVSLNQFKGFSILRSYSVQETADMLLNMAHKICREFKKGTPLFCNTMASNAMDSSNDYCNSIVKSVKKDNITKDNIGIVMLSQIPGISPAIARTLLKDTTITEFLLSLRDGGDNALNSILIETTNGKTRKLGRDIVRKLIDFFGETKPVS